MAIIRIRDENGKVQEILALRGEKGEKGQDGTVSFDELTEEQKASLKGDKGDRGDTGPKGDKGDGGTNVVQVTLTDNTSSHTPAQMKAVLDNGGVLVFNDGYSLYKLDDIAYCKKTEMTYGGKLIFKDTTVFEDGSVATYTEEHIVVGVGSVLFEDDGNGNVTIGSSGGEVSFTDDGNGNVNLEVM